eukprot:m.235857 g.235857  ORF g.235857 m.235857 type:complete len:297 (-) comp20310_c0_seq1:27-917(-)
MAAAADGRGASVQPPPLYTGPSVTLKPKYELTPEQQETLKTFRERLQNITDKEKKFCDDACLCRYLRARDWDVDAAEKLLRGTLKWRTEFGVDEITPESIDGESKTGKVYLHGFDKHKRPVMYQRPRRQNTKDYKNQVRQLVYMLEREIASMDLCAGVEQHVLVIDFKEYSMFNAPPMAVTKEVLTILMDHYPERLGTAFCVDAPMLFLMCWKVLKPFLPKATQEKVHFVSRSGTHGPRGTMDKHVAHFFDDEHLEAEYGGALPSEYVHDAYWSAEKQLFDEWKRKQGHHVHVASV